MKNTNPDSRDQSSKTFYRRDLPHWQPENRLIFITTRLHGSIPADTLRRMNADLQALEKELISRNMPQSQRALELARRRFGGCEAVLDQAVSATAATRWLEQPEIAKIVRDALYFRDGERYELQRYVIMPNHLHILLNPLPIAETIAPPTKPTPRWALAAIMKALKGFTAHEANKILGRKGRFWEDENFDHWVRDDAEADRIRLYIDRNPVKANLCGAPHQWPWSSACDAQERPSAG